VTRGHLALLALSVPVGLAAPAHAQDAAFGRGVWLSQANCSDCHGFFGNGFGEDPRAPKGANLRETTLDAAGLAEVILCGRPGTAMPYFDQRAYTDKRCYEATKADLGDQTPPAAQQQLTRRHADGLAAFIIAEFKGKGEPTQEECVALLGPTTGRCAQLPKAAK
jgi:mono/diheme cytochrome c family protein